MEQERRTADYGDLRGQDYGDLRGQLIAWVVLAIAIVLRAVLTGGF